MPIPPHPLVILAKEAVERYVRDGKVITPPAPLTEEMRQQAGVFVSIKRRGQLRGCIGTSEPVRENVALETISNAIGASARDPRFPPIAPYELPDLDYSVDLLSPLEPVDAPPLLDPRVHGLLVVSGDRRGLLLPDIPQVTTFTQQLEICRAKAGIDPEEPVALFCFTVRRYQLPSLE